MWAALCAIGVPGIGVPEEYGGQGGGVEELAVVLGELRLTSTPLLGSALAAKAVLDTGDERVCAELLPRIAAGESTTLAWTGHSGQWSTPACVWDGGLRGTAHYVLAGEHPLVLAHTPDRTVLCLPEHVTTAPSHAMDPGRELMTVRVDGPGRVLGGVDLAALRDFALVLVSAEAAGVAAEALRRTVDHAKTRVQFGRSIGSFQAVKHRLADLVLLVETARAAVGLALAQPGPRHAALAKVHCADALQAVAAEMVQLHGGIAITWEHEAHLFLKRAHGTAHLFGDTAYHLRRLAGLLGFTPSPSGAAR
ncbi:alkylation response protein AidB-like acyl-CoA dehydrogenase [Crossiella equi]|uniref:Alkylation response protein AidB-like acyl-CoA dehydrogenase n=1 Tax=Crossiella equi TaxID=130796 RepID=A0ABS5APB6_9PSEU|nr:acyl-CoA dehydrogenase family protein [Crossiella equi]MBP2478097.1 alkylation response protein AidB-like acyl-CoA dehydrogenase [Crossiella equi]